MLWQVIKDGKASGGYFKANISNTKTECKTNKQTDRRRYTCTLCVAQRQVSIHPLKETDSRTHERTHTHTRTHTHSCGLVIITLLFIYI